MLYVIVFDSFFDKRKEANSLPLSTINTANGVSGYEDETSCKRRMWGWYRARRVIKKVLFRMRPLMFHDSNVKDEEDK